MRLLAPSDPDGWICSFKGIVYYPFKFSVEEADTWRYKFTEEEVQVAFPRKIITLSYTGRVDVFECYFKGIEQYQNLTSQEFQEEDIWEDNEKEASEEEVKEASTEKNKTAEVDQRNLTLNKIAEPSVEEAKQTEEKEYAEYQDVSRKIFETPKVEPKEKKENDSTPIESLTKKDNMASFLEMLEETKESAKEEDDDLAENIRDMSFGKPRQISFGKDSEDKMSNKSPFRQEFDNKIKEDRQNINPINIDFSIQEIKNKAIEKKGAGEMTSAELLAEKIRQEKLKINEKIESLEDKEKKYLDNIKEPFCKTFLIVQYEMANEINKNFKELLEVKISLENESAENCKHFISKNKSNLSVLSLESDKAKLAVSDFLQNLRNQYEINEKLKNYWETAQIADMNSFDDIKSKIKENDLFTKDIDKVSEKFKKILLKEENFSKIINYYTSRSETLSKKILKQRTIKLKGGLDDPLFSRGNKSGVINRINQDVENTSTRIKMSRNYYHNQNKEFEEQQKLCESYICELIEGDAYLLQILDDKLENLNQNLSKLKWMDSVVPRSMLHNSKFISFIIFVS